MNRGRKAVLKSPQSKRWRDGRVSPDLAKRLECVRLQRRFSDGVAHPKALASRAAGSWSQGAPDRLACCLAMNLVAAGVW